MLFMKRSSNTGYSTTMRQRKKVVWANPQAEREAGSRVPTHHLGHFPQPGARSEAPFVAEPGSLWALRGHAYMIGDAWAGSELEEGAVPYVWSRSYGPSPKSMNTRTVPANTMAIYAETRRLSEWDGRGIARPERPLFIVDGVLCAVVEPDTLLKKI